MLHVPAHFTPFIGRSKELSELAALLADSRCRLITLVGPGGSGKSRLAAEVVRANAELYLDGAFFIFLQPVSSRALLVSAVADTLGYTARGADDETQLLETLRDKRALLVLDNFEHLIDDADFLNDILEYAPGMKLLATSREVLNLREEWLYPVLGMPFPLDANDRRLETYDAVQLFMEHAQRVRRDFLLHADRVHVVRLCQIVEGMPLALELAASWLKSLTCADIVQEIERSLDFLSTSMRNVPIRHRSMRSVFDQSWKLLSEDEQQTFSRLSVFRGGFWREAAEQVAGATLGVLSALVDKSLIWREAGGRYQIHELLRQYAGERLADSAEEVRQVQHAHAEYFMTFLQRREFALHGDQQRETVRELEMEIDNLRAALRWAIDSADPALLRIGAWAYYDFMDIQGRYHEGCQILVQAIDRLTTLDASEERDFTLAILRCAAANLCIRMGQFDEARTSFYESARLYADLNQPPPPGFGTEPLIGMGLLATTMGRFDDAEALSTEGIRRVEMRDDKLSLAFGLYVLATATYSQGKFDAAFHHARRSYQESEALGDRWFAAYALIVMGDVMRATEDYERAQEYYQSSYDIKQQFNDMGGTAFAVNCLARIAWLRGDYPEAARLYRQGQDLYREVHDPGGLATSLFGLGDAAQRQGDLTVARDSFDAALKIALEIRWVPLILMILTGVSEALLKADRAELAVELLTLAVHHPFNDVPARRRSEDLLQRAQEMLPADLFERASVRGAAANLETAALSLREALSLSGFSHHHALPPHAPLHQDLIEPLSERELEILHLMSDGLTNQQIAEKLTIVLGTVKAHNHNIFGKLGVNNRVQAIARARALNLL